MATTTRAPGSPTTDRWVGPTTAGVLSALPGLALMAAGYFHPERLDEGTAHRWWTLHVPGMLVFPLVGVALMWLFKGRRDPLAVVAVLAAFVYAIFYNALDILSGIGAGWVTSRLPSGAARPDEVRSIFAIGTPLGEIGSWGLLVAAVVVALDALLRHRLAGLPGLLLVPGAVLLHLDHIYWPQGALGIGLVGLATGWLAYVGRRSGSVMSTHRG
ncbi:hypothetical protein SAMN04488570_1830 [Nocardioides scoriae]|uniref:Uncharacterized protein n=1 Tax=Nocardioides scoriae TaxID=642780 RepID=A0A1H1S0X6_9ACTN|nr:hypothetical protein [Nocardioides scoriae]SDS41617.1 hypothetical protein SAMN04488570_1830 [Nocardioides scoriae]